jgi:leucyl aminopeptidase
MINRNLEDIDKLFREGLNTDGDQYTSADADWSKLKDRLARNEKRKRGVFWLSRLGGVAALVLLFFTIRMLLPEDRKQIIQQAEVQLNDHKLKKVEQSQPTASVEVKKTVNKTESGSNIVLAQNKPLGKQLSQKHFLDRSAESKTPENDTAQVESLSIAEASTRQTVDMEERKLSPQDMVKSVEQLRSSADESLFAPNEKPNVLPEPEHQYRKLALSVLAAPDYNGVNNLNNASVGSDFGLIVTFKVSKN